MGKKNMIYRPENDRSEDFGWKKVSEETRPTEDQQQRWSLISIVVAVALGKIAIIFG